MRWARCNRRAACPLRDEFRARGRVRARPVAPRQLAESASGRAQARGLPRGGDRAEREPSEQPRPQPFPPGAPHAISADICHSRLGLSWRSAPSSSCHHAQSLPERAPRRREDVGLSRASSSARLEVLGRRREVHGAGPALTDKAYSHLCVSRGTRPLHLVCTPQPSSDAAPSVTFTSEKSRLGVKVEDDAAGVLGPMMAMRQTNSCRGRTPSERTLSGLLARCPRQMSRAGRSRSLLQRLARALRRDHESDLARSWSRAAIRGAPREGRADRRGDRERMARAESGDAYVKLHYARRCHTRRAGLPKRFAAASPAGSAAAAPAGASSASGRLGPVGRPTPPRPRPPRRRGSRRATVDALDEYKGERPAEQPAAGEATVAARRERCAARSPQGGVAHGSDAWLPPEPPPAGPAHQQPRACLCGAASAPHGPRAGATAGGAVAGPAAPSFSSGLAGAAERR